MHFFYFNIKIKKKIALTHPYCTTLFKTGFKSFYLIKESSPLKKLKIKIFFLFCIPIAPNYFQLKLNVLSQGQNIILY